MYLTFGLLTEASLIQSEINLFAEELVLTWPKYRENRIAHVSEFYENKAEALAIVSFLSSWKPRIGVYAGSFNPFHKGHLNILQKAESLFDKVIVARGSNPEKDVHTFDLPQVLKSRQVDNYDTLLTDYLETLEYQVILIRGLRNATDFQYELNQYRYLTDLKPDVQVVSIFCDKEFEHISSSGIRTLQKFGRADKYLLD